MTQSFKWTADIIKKDAIAGTSPDLMAIPPTVGICLMSEYPIQTGLLTVIFSCVIGFVTFLFRPRNFVGTSGFASGLAPVLALGIHTFGIQNMPFLIFLTIFFQMLVWYNNWATYNHRFLVLVSFVASTILLLSWLLRSGKIVDKIAHSIVVGFTIGIAVVIAFSQVGEIMDLTII